MKINENIFVPDNPEERKQKRLQMIYRKLQQKHIEGNLDLTRIPITHLGNLETISGHLYLSYTKIKDLGNLKSVGGMLALANTDIKDLGNLKKADLLFLRNTPVAEKYTEEEIREMVDVRSTIYL